MIKHHPAYSYEYDTVENVYYILLYGRRTKGFRTVATEQEAQRQVADMFASQEEADRDEIRYKVP